MSQLNLKIQPSQTPKFDSSELQILGYQNLGLQKTKKLILPKPQILFCNQRQNSAGRLDFDLYDINFGLLLHNVWKTPKYYLHSIDRVACLEEARHIEQIHKSLNHISSHLVGCTHCWKYVVIDGK